jgi:TonB-dependent SusC/RagA subfamily outer membrane receptor
MSLLIALLKINITLAVCYSLYYFLLRKLTFYNLNRVFFFCTIALSMVMPFINIELEPAPVKTLDMQDAGSVYTIPVLTRDTVRFIDFIPLLFWAGVIFMGLRLLVQLSSVGLLYLRSRSNTIEGTTVRIMQSHNNPFSFFKSIFINPGLLPQEELHMVLNHEKVHARQWHSLDILLGELNKTLCWFNPAAWLMMHAIKQNLEFIADREVLKKGTESRAYQYSLLRVSQTGQSITLTNNFNFSHLKTRIIMMNKKQSSPIHVTRYFVAAPLALALICCFGVSMAQQKKLTVKETPQQEQRQEKEVKLQIKPAATDKKQAVTGTEAIKTVRIIQAVNADKPGAQGDKVAVVEMKSGQIREIVLDRESADNKPQLKKDNPLVMLDGKKIDYAQAETIDPKAIESVTILKDADATAQYGAEAKEGVILIRMKKD